MSGGTSSGTSLPVETCPLAASRVCSGIRSIHKKGCAGPDSSDICCSDGLVHHWVGIVFIPGVTIQRTVAVLQDYDNHQITYGPYIRRSKPLRREGNDFDVFLQFYRKAIVTVVLDAEFQVHYAEIDPARTQSRSYSTRIAEVENPGQPNGPPLVTRAV